MQPFEGTMALRSATGGRGRREHTRLPVFPLQFLQVGTVKDCGLLKERLDKEWLEEIGAIPNKASQSTAICILLCILTSLLGVPFDADPVHTHTLDPNSY